MRRVEQAVTKTGLATTVHAKDLFDGLRNEREVAAPLEKWLKQTSPTGAATARYFARGTPP